MATLAQIKRFIEGTDFLGGLQTDVQDIESGIIASIEQGYNDLAYEINLEPEYQDLFSDPYSISKQQVQKVTQDAQSYIQSYTLQVQQPNSGPGDYINLYVGTASEDSDGDIDENYQDATYDPNTGYYDTPAASLWEIMSNPNLNLINDMGDAYSDGGLGCDWASGNFSWYSEWDGNPNDNGQYNVAQGSVAQWAPYIHLSGSGDSSAMNADVGLPG